MGLCGRRSAASPPHPVVIHRGWSRQAQPTGMRQSPMTPALRAASSDVKPLVRASVRRPDRCPNLRHATCGCLVVAGTHPPPSRYYGLGRCVGHVAAAGGGVYSGHGGHVRTGQARVAHPRHRPQRRGRHSGRVRGRVVAGQSLHPAKGYGGVRHTARHGASATSFPTWTVLYDTGGRMKG